MENNLQGVVELHSHPHPPTIGTEQLTTIGTEHHSIVFINASVAVASFPKGL